MRLLRSLPVLAGLLAAVPAAAQSYDENPSGETLYLLADLRLTAADGELSWLDGGFGKARWGGERDGDLRVRARAVEADLVWQPHLTWSLDGTIAATLQQGQEHAVDLSEAFLSYRHDPIGTVRMSGRLGVVWPPVSLEHGGPAWSVTEMVTPSAINSWIGEEVKVAAAEASVAVPLAGGHLTATAALFGFNDTAGTLIAFRGWALHDEKATLFGRQPLPPLDAFMQEAQAPATRPMIELDDRPGVYGKVGWRGETVTLQALYYDNRGDPEAVNDQLQWGWRTRFGSLAARIAIDPATQLSAQAMTGSTRMGFAMDDRIWVDTGFRSAFLLATRRFGDEASVSGRVEAFGTRAHGSVTGRESDEDGWAATLAARHRIGDHVTVLVEGLHVESDRDERSRVLLPARQRQSVMQLVARIAR